MLPVGSNSYQFTSYSVSVAVVSYTASCSLLALTRSVICRNRKMRYKYRLIKVLILYYSASLARLCEHSVATANSHKLLEINNNLERDRDGWKAAAQAKNKLKLRLAD